MKMGIILALALLFTPIKPHSPIIKAMCAVQQVCNQCTATDQFGNTHTYTCGCHVICLPGTED